MLPTVLLALALLGVALALRPITSASKSASSRSVALHSTKADYALLFDCDGVIVETEELHRLAYNKAFEKFGLRLPNGKPVNWDVAYYDILQNTVGGGKPKMMHYFNKEAKAWPVCTRPYKAAPRSDAERTKLVDDLQDAKTEFYKKIINELATARVGVLELMDEAIADPSLKVGICSAATKGGFEKLVNAIVGPERLSKLDVVMAGDDVKAKKPDPMIYNVAREKIGIPADKCVVVEDSVVGLKAAKAAGMKCIITYTDSTAREDFYGLGADAKVPNLMNVHLDKIFGPLRAGSTEILAGIRDPTPAEVAAAKAGKGKESQAAAAPAAAAAAPKAKAVKEAAAAKAEAPKENAPPKAPEPKKVHGWGPSSMTQEKWKL